jgi:hypothetical protein
MNFSCPFIVGRVHTIPRSQFGLKAFELPEEKFTASHHFVEDHFLFSSEDFVRSIEDAH